MRFGNIIIEWFLALFRQFAAELTLIVVHWRNYVNTVKLFVKFDYFIFLHCIPASWMQNFQEAITAILKSSSNKVVIASRSRRSGKCLFRDFLKL